MATGRWLARADVDLSDGEDVVVHPPPLPRRTPPTGGPDARRASLAAARPAVRRLHAATTAGADGSGRRVRCRPDQPPVRRRLPRGRSQGSEDLARRRPRRTRRRAHRPRGPRGAAGRRGNRRQDVEHDLPVHLYDRPRRNDRPRRETGLVGGRHARSGRWIARPLRADGRDYGGPVQRSSLARRGRVQLLCCSHPRGPAPQALLEVDLLLDDVNEDGSDRQFQTRL